jgi:hypothetical protein
MDLAKRDLSSDHAGIDHISRFIRALAIGMIVLGTVSPCSTGMAFFHRFRPQLPT